MLHGNPQACEKALARAGLTFDDMAVIAKKHGFPVVAVTSVEDPVTDRMMEAAAKAEFCQVRVMPEINQYLQVRGIAPFSIEHPEGYMKSDLAVSLTDGHPSAIQHTIIARKLLKQLEESGAKVEIK